MSADIKRHAANVKRHLDEAQRQLQWLARHMTDAFEGTLSDDVSNAYAALTNAVAEVHSAGEDLMPLRWEAEEAPTAAALDATTGK